MGRNIKKAISLAFCAVVVFFAAAGIYYFGLESGVLTAQNSTKPPPPIPSYLQPDEKNNVEVVQKAAPWVVFVHNIRVYQDIFSFDGTQVQQGAGSGFIWDSRGYVVTNFHVIQEADEVAVTLRDGRNFKAKVVGVEPAKDIAVLKIEGKDLPSPGFEKFTADSDKIFVGQKCIAIGNPFGLDQSMTQGVISAIGRNYPSVAGVTIRNMIQTDAAINPGNSGGPMLDSRGYLMGMNTAIVSRSGGSEGVGFAVPANTIRRVVTQIIQYGKVINPTLGIEPLPQRYADHLSIRGVVVMEVDPNGPAGKAGIKGMARDRWGQILIGDVIVGIDQEKLDSFDDLYSTLENKKIGDEVVLTFVRRGKKHTVKLNLGSK